MSKEVSDVKTYTVEANIKFTVEAPSITKAYKEFERWMIMAFEASYAGGVVTHPAVVPSYYEGVSITKAVK